MRSFLIATLMLSSVSAFAADHGSEYFWQAGAGQTYIVPELEFFDGSVDLKGGGDVDTKGTNISVAGEWGYTADMAFGAELTMVKQETGDTEDSGLGNIELYMKGNHALTTGALKYGVALSISPGNYEIESNGDGNGYTGGHALVPYIGYEHKGDITCGAKISHELGLGDKTWEQGGAEADVKGADTTALAIFAETAHSAGTWGASLTHAMTSDYEFEDGSKEEISDSTTLAVYGDYGMNEGTTLTGSLGYSMIGSTDAIDDGSAMTLLLGARFAL